MSEIIASCYEIIRKIGAGGGGTVFLARHLRLGKKVVLKADKRKITTKEELLRREVDVLKELSHTYIPQVYDFFIEGDTVYTVIDYVEGESLDKPLRNGKKFSQAQVIRWAGQLLEALCYLHSPTHGDPPRGFVHSDIKPANIMLGLDDNVCLIDFNIALALGEKNVIGRSPGYASPEHYGMDFTTEEGAETARQAISQMISQEQKSREKMADPDVTEKEYTSPDSDITEREQTSPDSDVTEREQTFPDSDVTEREQTFPDSDVTEREQTFSDSDVTEREQTFPDSDATEREQTFPDSDVTEKEQTFPDSDVTLTDHTLLEKEDSGSLSSLMESKQSETSNLRYVVPDVRSDIYSLGATLYHLLSGKRPSKYVTEVVPLSEQEFSPQIVKIISRAMDINPDLRYQTAEEMLYDFLHLRENDERVRRRKRIRIAACSAFTFMFLTGVLISFTGLKRMQTTEQWLKLAEYSQNALAKGDSDSALRYALQALPEQTGILFPDYTAQAQKALTDALGVYDLSDGFKTHKTVELPAAPFCMAIAPDGSTAAFVYAYSMAIVDTDTADLIATLPAEESALAEAVYLNPNIIVFAGKDGITAYDIGKKAVLWTGKPATSIAVSGDGKSVAAVYKEESSATIYDTMDGQIKAAVDFQGRHQQVTVNDRFANPRDNLLALNADGSLLGVSFADGSLEIFDLNNSENNMQIFDRSSGYIHFEGGFYQQYFAFTASDSLQSVFAVIDMESGEQTGGFQSESGFSVQTDETGIYVQTENLLLKLHPVTGEQTPLVTTAENILRYARSDTHTLITTENEFWFFDNNAMETSGHKKEYDSDFVQIAAGTALIGSMDTPVIRMMKYENHSETELLSYDAAYDHDEARVSEDGETVMLFSYERFCLYGKDGTYLGEVSVPEPEQVYDQQYIRDAEGSRLEMIYYDGQILAYDARDGALLYEKSGEMPDPELQETFYTDSLRIESPLHGTPAAYDKDSGRLVRELEQDAYLTYVTQAGEYVVVQYVTAEGYCFGQLLNEKCEVLAELPYLCDVIGERLIFDYPTGDLRETKIFELEELREMAEKGVSVCQTDPACSLQFPGGELRNLY